MQTSRTEVVAREPSHEERVAAAKKLWKTKNNKTFQEIRATLRAMASGRERCMYCEDSMGTDIEHFRPMKRYPEHAFSWPNYLLACSHCNSNEKRTQFPLDENGRHLLINPTAEDPEEHLDLSPQTGKFKDVTPKGEKSIDVFGLNRGGLEDGRKERWYVLTSLIECYARDRRKGRQREADERMKAIVEGTFSCVLWYLLRVARMPAASRVLNQECLDALRDYGADIERVLGNAE